MMVPTTFGSRDLLAALCAFTHFTHFRYSRSRVSPTAVIQGIKPTSKFNEVSRFHLHISWPVRQLAALCAVVGLPFKHNICMCMYIYIYI